MAPVTVTGWNQDLIAETTNADQTTSCGFDVYPPANTVYYSAGFPGATSGGLPANGTITSAYNASTGNPTIFQLASFTGNNALHFNGEATGPVAPHEVSGVLSLAQAEPFTQIAILQSGTNCQSNKTDLLINYTLNFADGTTTSGSFNASDWSSATNATNVAISGLGNVGRNVGAGNYNVPTQAGNLELHETDIPVPASEQSSLLTSISLSTPGTDFAWAAYAVSGLVNGNASIGTFIWNGDVNSSLDTTTPNFQGSVPYAAFHSILFDDSAIGTTSVVVSPNTSTASIVFNNNSLGYNISGSTFSIGGTLNVTGNAPVTFGNVLNVSSGTVISGGGPATFNSGFSTTGFLNVSGSGLVLFNAPVNSSGGVSLSGNGTTIFASNLKVTNSLTIPGSGPVAFNGSTNVSGPILLSGNGPVTFNGAMNTGSSLSVVNNATLTLNGASTIASTFNVSYGTAIISPTGSVTTPSLNVGSLGSLTVQTGGSITGPGVTPLALTGSGLITLNGFTLPAGTGTAYQGSLTGSGGLNLSNGYVTATANSLTLTGPILIGNSATSTAYLLVTDGSGTAGQLSNGSPITVTLAGTGPIGTDNGYSGALHNPDNGGNSTFSGNIVIAPVGAVISSGFQSSLTLNGVISGTGPVTFSTNADSRVILNGVSTYTGETRMVGNVATLASIDQDILQLSVDNGVSTVSGMNFTGSPAQLMFDLNGHRQTVAYLTGGNATTLITNNNPSASSVITVNTPAGTNATYNGLLTDSGGQLAFVKTGPGTQTLAAVNTYTQGTTVAGGTLIPSNSNALGSGTVTMAGGTLSLTAVNVAPLTGFGSFTMNGSGFTPTVSGSVLQLTTGVANETTSALTKVLITPANGFTASFLYTPKASGTNGGATFVMESDPRGLMALGTGGTSLGYGGTGAITPSAALQFSLFSPAGIGFGTNGTISDTTNPSTVSGMNIHLGDPFQITLNYSGVTDILSETIKDTVFQKTYTFNYSANLNSILGGSSAYIGFTGATSGTTLAQTITNFVFNNGGIAPPTSIPNAVTTAVGTSSVITAAVAPGGSQVSIGALSVSPNSTLTLAGNSLGTTAKLVVITPSLSISGNTNNWTGKLDITGGALDVQTASLSDVTNQVKQGFNAGGAAWQGSAGITSSTAATDSTHLTAVGVIINNDNGNQLYGSSAPLGTFDGASPGANDVLVKYTYFGDTNLDGKVDGTDYGRIDNGYLTQATGWYNGDFNYDGVINGSDYTLIDNAFNTQGVSLAAQIASPTASVTSEIAATAAVPEPTTLALVGVAALSLMRRRRQLGQ